MLSKYIDALQPYLQQIRDQNYEAINQLQEQYNQDHVLEGKQATQIDEILDSISVNFDKVIDSLFQEYDSNSLCLLSLMTSVFGLYVPYRLRQLNLLDYLTQPLLELSKKFYQYQANLSYCQWLLSGFQELRVRRVFQNDKQGFLKSLERLQPTGIQFKTSIFDRKYYDLIILRDMYECSQDKEVLDRLLLLFNQVKAITITKLHQIMIDEFQHYLSQVDYRTKMQMEYEEQNRKYQEIFKLKMVMNEQDLKSRDRFILNECLVPESQNVEYKDLANLNNPRQRFIVKKAVTAFLNSQYGGSLYIGVKDNQRVTGILCSPNEIIKNINDEMATIHPKIYANYQYKIEILPIFSYETAEEMHPIKVVRINVQRDKDSEAIYSFHEFTQFDTEAIFCFYRINDESKLLRDHQFKHMIQTRTSTYPKPFKRNSPVKEALPPQPTPPQNPPAQNKRQPKEEPQKQKQQHQNEKQSTTKTNITFVDSREAKVLRNVYPQNDPFERNKKQTKIQIEEPKKSLDVSFTDFQKCTVLRKISKSCYPHLKAILDKMQNNSYIMKITEIAQNFIIQFIGDDKIIFMEDLQREAAELNQPLLFTYGNPTVIQMKNWQENITKDTVKDKSIEIQKALLISNFEIIQKSQYCNLKSKYLNDLIKIYEFLKITQSMEVHWKLEETTEFKYD